LFAWSLTALSAQIGYIVPQNPAYYASETESSLYKYRHVQC